MQHPFSPFYDPLTMIHQPFFHLPYSITIHLPSSTLHLPSLTIPLPFTYDIPTIYLAPSLSCSFEPSPKGMPLAQPSNLSPPYLDLAYTLPMFIRSHALFEPSPKGMPLAQPSNLSTFQRSNPFIIQL